MVQKIETRLPQGDSTDINATKIEDLGLPFVIFEPRYGLMDLVLQPLVDRHGNETGNHLFIRDRRSTDRQNLLLVAAIFKKEDGVEIVAVEGKVKIDSGSTSHTLKREESYSLKKETDSINSIHLIDKQTIIIRQQPPVTFEIIE